MIKNENVKFCTDCGHKNNKINSFCINCGNELVQDKLEYVNSNNTKVINKKVNTITTSKVDTSIDDLDMDDVNRFIAKNAEYYNQKFDQINKTGNKITWNWAAFFLNLYWMLYRKMYIQGGILVLVSIVTTAISSAIPFLGIILGWGLNIVVGMYANSIYMSHVSKKLGEIEAMGPEMKDTMIIKKGGTNIAIPLILLGIYLIAIIGIVVLFGVVFGSMLYY